MDQTAETPRFLGCLEGHRDWVTSIRTPPVESNATADTVVSSSRDKKVIVWKLHPRNQDNDNIAGYAVRSLSGHSQPIQDLALSQNGKFAITGSWDSTLRLWDIENGRTIRTFNGHTSDVYSVALSPDNRQILSGSRDKTIRLWNTRAECKYTIKDNQHTDWVSCVRFSPNSVETLIVSCGWDKLVKVWNLDGCDLKTNLVNHKGPLYTLTVSPDGSLCASGGKDGIAMLWDVNEGRHLFSIQAHSTINALCFSPCNYWLCVATDDGIKIWNLEDDKSIIWSKKSPNTFDDANKATSSRPSRASGIPWCVSLAWSADGKTLFAGSTDGKIYVYDFPRE